MSLTFSPEQVARLSPPLPKSRGRKNLGVIVQAVNHLYSHGKTVIQSKDVVPILRTLGLDAEWDLSDDAQDDYGLNRAIGDALGGHGLLLEKKGGKARGGNRYIIPDGGITADYLKSKSIVI